MRYIVLFLILMLAHAAAAQTTRLYPPADDQSLVNHQPWSDAQLKNPNGYTVLTPSGSDDYPQIRDALLNSKNQPVLLKGLGQQFKISRTIHLYTGGILVGENGLYYDKYRSPPASVEIQGISGFRGSSYIACGQSAGWEGATYVNGDYCYIRGITVDPNYQDQAVFTGSIASTTLTVTGITGTLGIGQWINDGGVNVGGDTFIVSQIDGTPGGNGHYTINYAQTVTTPQTMNGAIACFENQANASFTTMENIQADRCTGDGYRVVGDINAPGGQGFGNGVIIRPILQNSAFLNQNHGYGIFFDEPPAGGNVSDTRMDNVNTGSNLAGAMHFRGSTGQINGPRMEFDGKGIYIQQSNNIQITNAYFDNEFGPFLILNAAPGVYVTGGLAFIRGGNSTTIGIDITGANQLFMSNFTNGLQYAFKVEGGGSLTGRLEIPPLVAAAYPDTLTESQVAPLIARGATPDNPPIAVTLTGGAFAAPDLLSSANSVFNLSHAGCAGGTGGHCAIPNPTIAPSLGSAGIFEVHQSITGTDTVAWGTSYVNPPTLSTSGADYVPWYAASNGSIVLETPNANKLTTTPVPSNPNLLALPFDFSGAGWTTIGIASVLTGQVGPDGSAAILATEDNSSGAHGLTNTTPLGLAPDTYTVSFYFKTGSGGSFRYGGLQLDETGGVSDNVEYNTGDCSFTGANGSNIVGRGCILSPNGYGRMYMTIAAPNTVLQTTFAMGVYPTQFYTGDGVSNGYMWGPVLRQGAAP